MADSSSRRLHNDTGYGNFERTTKRLARDERSMAFSEQPDPSRRRKTFRNEAERGSTSIFGANSMMSSNDNNNSPRTPKTGLGNTSPATPSTQNTPSHSKGIKSGNSSEITKKVLSPGSSANRGESHDSQVAGNSNIKPASSSEMLFQKLDAAIEKGIKSKDSTRGGLKRWEIAMADIEKWDCDDAQLKEYTKELIRRRKDPTHIQTTIESIESGTAAEKQRQSEPVELIKSVFANKETWAAQRGTHGIGKTLEDPIERIVVGNQISAPVLAIITEALGPASISGYSDETMLKMVLPDEASASSALYEAELIKSLTAWHKHHGVKVYDSDGQKKLETEELQSKIQLLYERIKAIVKDGQSAKKLNTEQE